VHRASTIVSAADNVQLVVLYSLALIGLIVVAMAVVLRLRRWLQSDDQPPGTGFTLSDLRALYEQGAMTSEEFEKARAKIVAGAKAMTEKMPSPLARPDRPDKEGR
jgi:hypothetical protein